MANLSKILTLGLLSTPLLSIAQKKPNVIIILADDIGYGDIEWVEDLPTINTPNIKRLADESLCFSNAHCTSATSTPSRYGLLTGKYPWRKKGKGIASGDAPLIIPPNSYTVATMFQSQGYHTAAIGKWHLGLGDKRGEQQWNSTVSPNPSDIGFAYSYLMAATADRTPCVFIENGKVENLDPKDPIQVSYTSNFEGQPTGYTNPEMLRLHPSHGHDMTIVDSISRIGYMKGGESARWHDEDIADKITDKAVAFIQKNKNEPFFLYFGTNDIHVPRMPHDRFKGKSGMGLRGDAILSFDYSIGKIIDTLDALGIADNTIIILTSDNGPVIDDGYQDQAVALLGNHQPSGTYRGGKYSAYQAGTRVPMMIRWKNGNIKNNINDNLFSHVDLLASLADIIGVKISPKNNLDSQNNAKHLLGKSKKGRKYILTNNANNTLSITTKQWRYIEPSKGARYNAKVNIELGNEPYDQLYYIKEDSKERINLATKKKKKTAQLKQILAKEKSKGYLE